MARASRTHLHPLANTHTLTEALEEAAILSEVQP
ncbi:unnamed protein product (plasmid) [Mycetohabitans rhizoxinica HKI 454]|uniref:Uncharacterized protein n=1 Tax=Mycetohabitans rhizoxinica (strain DSM 19002 / CIP 109453 / HKI 454) TaxID=882378 RepID=E5AW68_MYCRK|nr:unnamed protein product [Mycetohabitans rhizoxinica HKI 454]